MIKFADKDELLDCVRLASRCFDEEIEYTSGIFENLYSKENLIIYKENSEVLGMLFMIDYEISTGGTAYYLYYVCTDENHRGKGVMKAILSFAKDAATDKKGEFLFLVPADENLRKMYYKIGYTVPFVGGKQEKLPQDLKLQSNMMNSRNKKITGRYLIPSLKALLQLKNTGYKGYSSGGYYVIKNDDDILEVIGSNSTEEKGLILPINKEFDYKDLYIGLYLK